MFLLIDKPKGITSHDVVNRIRRIINRNRGNSDESRAGNGKAGNRNETDRRQDKRMQVKVGHAGTLDPNATGLLIVGVGRESTKQLWTKFGKLDKTYVAEIVLGEEREGDDSTGEVVRNISQKHVRASHGTKSVRAFGSEAQSRRDDITGLKSLPVMSNTKMQEVLAEFVGEQMQVPPAYSAIKIKGKPAYKIARERFWTSQNDSLSASNDIKLESRKVTIHSIKLLDYKYPVLKIETRVSSGTYIRSLARDIGRKLGCGAYLSELRRIKIGGYRVEKSMILEELSDQFLISNI